MSYKEYAMGMSFRLNPKHIRKDTFLVPFEGLSREQEMYDTYISPLDSSSEELVAGYNEGGLVEREKFAVKGAPTSGFQKNVELTYDIVNDQDILDFVKKELGEQKFKKLKFSEGKPYGVSQRENKNLFRAVKSAIKKYNLIEQGRRDPSSVRYGEYISNVTKRVGERSSATGGEFSNKSLAEVLDIEEKLSKDVGKILAKQDDSLIPSRAELGRKYKISDSTVERIIRDYFGDTVYENKWNKIASAQRLVGDDKILYDTIVDLDTISAKSLSNDLGWTVKKTNEKMNSLLSKIYTKRSTGVSSFLPDDYPLLSQVVDKIRSAPDFEDIYQRRIGDLVLNAYPTNSKADMAAKKLIKTKLGEYWKVTRALRKEFPQLSANLDHVVPFNFLQEVEAGKNPLDLIRVKPVPQIVNKFKINFDKARTNNIKALNANPTDKQALNQYKALKKLEKTLPFSVGGTSKSGKILEWGAPRIGEADLLDDLEKFPEIYNETVSYINKVKSDPKLQKLFFEAGLLSKDLPTARQFKFERLSQYQPLTLKEQKNYTQLLDNLINKGVITQDERQLITQMSSNPMFDPNLYKSLGQDVMKIATKIAPAIGTTAKKAFQFIIAETPPGVAAVVAADLALGPGKEIATGGSAKEIFKQSGLLNPFGVFGSVDDATFSEMIKFAKESGRSDNEIQKIINFRKNLMDANQVVENQEETKDILESQAMSDVLQLEVGESGLGTMGRQDSLNRLEKETKQNLTDYFTYLSKDTFKEDGELSINLLKDYTQQRAKDSFLGTSSPEFRTPVERIGPMVTERFLGKEVESEGDRSIVQQVTGSTLEDIELKKEAEQRAMAVGPDDSFLLESMQAFESGTNK